MEVLLDALATLRAQGLPVRLRAVGGFETPQYEREVKGLVEKLGLSDAVEWTGFTEDVDGELAEMDLFVLPSLFGEGLPMVVLEAMAARVPVVATRVEGVPEAIRDGVDGLLADPGDPRSLARAIGRVIHGEVDWHQMRTRALARHAEAFSDRSMAAGVAEVYRRVLKAK
jgi:glycosyltransferase involved in cell wall biosynthesis